MNIQKNYFDVIDFSKIINWHQQYKEEQNKRQKEGLNFNIFDVFWRSGIGIGETTQSKLLKFLLEPTETHGCGKLFLLEFLKMLNIEQPEKGTWEISAEKGRVDILLKRNFPQSVIVIENKSNWAVNQWNQLYRYWYQEIFSKTKQTEKTFYLENKNCYMVVYLAPTSKKEPTEQTLTKPEDFPSVLPEKIPMEITLKTFYDDIYQWLENCKSKIPTHNQRVIQYVNQYQELCKNL
ncbi:PD-(D/E)XK nuclease family protein [Capnocytophaga canimorsus]|uniref:PD-(D/E)XK nuclease family protein n=1 Tax=Capnocytophaga canimorsus TaxID=28188 RepID=UPI0028EF0BB9|nr:PD-(D/E)XK nuclease family protein [Capnocytophaga canimorsus]MDT9500479.1 PD-(D/E)XK nuclease family protein [Capnocytophaga canimorsus]